MSYQVIARKWRPQAFEEVTGQEHITQTLRNAIEHDRLHHAYLFSGARGVGKTTTARLLAKALNCHKSDKPTISPCKSTDPDPCPSCVEISESRSIDVFEFDAASHTKVEEIRDIILEGINFQSARDRYKVFIIDEVHMLSTSSFNALLKTVEEPPPGVVFIMATTELHKVPETITSRCQEFIFRTIPQQKIFERLKLIAEAEKINIADVALRELARSGEGSMRDAQSNFDQVISFSGERIEVTDVTSGLGMAGRDVLIKTVKAIADRDARSQLEVVDSLITEGHDLRNYCRDLLSVVRDLMVYKIAGNSEILLEGAMLEPEQVEELASGFSESDLLRFFNSIAETETNLKDATQPRFMLELGLVRLVEMRRLNSLETIIERLGALEKAYSTGEPIPEAPRTQSAAAADSTANGEKKTLIPESPPVIEAAKPEAEPEPEPEFEPEMPEPSFDEEPPEYINNVLPEPPDEPDFIPQGNNSWDDLAFVEALPERPIEISADRLEHYDHTRLDDRFEEQLLIAGDEIKRMPFATELVSSFTAKKAVAASASTTTNGSRPIDPAYLPPVVVEEDLPIPVLGEDPSEEDLLAYANSHPDIRRIARILRATVVEVQKL